MSLRRRIPVLVTALAVLVPFVAACGGGGAAETPEALCEGPAGTLGEGLLCSDGGFRVSVNDFAFPNWTGVQGTTDALDAGVMIRLFGAQTVCSSGTSAGDCVLNPVAQETLDQWTEALGGGHCEGMATLSLRYFLGLQSPAEAEAGASTAAALTRPQETVDREINTWWATQFVPEVRKAAAESRKKSPTELVNELIKGLKNKTGYTIGIYSDGYGHAVTPYAVTKSGETYSVHIYDNNFPGISKTITVDEGSDTWSYTDGSQNTDGTPYTWKGGKGTFELTPMSVRTGPFSDEFGAMTDGAKGMSIVGLSVKGNSNGTVRPRATGLLVTTTSGKRTGVVDGRIVNEIPGATYTIGKGGLGTSLVTVEIPDDEEFTVDPQPASTSAPEGVQDITISVATPDGSRTAVRESRELRPGTPPTDGLKVGNDGRVTVRPRNGASVSVSNNMGNVRLDLPANGTLTSSHRAGKGPEISGTDAAGKPLVKKSLPEARARKTRAAGTGPASVPGPAPAGDGSSTMVPRSSSTAAVVRSTTTTLPGRSTTTTIVPRSTTTTLVRRTTTTTTTLAPRKSTTTTTVPRSTTTTLVPRTTTTTLVPRSTTTTLVPRSTTTTSP